ncbi:MAG: NAD(P)-binding domain-containing protein [Ignavibacteriae bacterium]|nr:NAD(P)-binding domain-containing protein [Ignavibacteriota bacterium]
MKDVIVIGAGPAGLACGIAATRAGLRCTIVEQGSVADAIRRFPVQMTWFSTPNCSRSGTCRSSFRPSAPQGLIHSTTICGWHASSDLISSRMSW